VENTGNNNAIILDKLYIFLKKLAQIARMMANVLSSVGSHR